MSQGTERMTKSNDQRTHPSKINEQIFEDKWKPKIFSEL